MPEPPFPKARVHPKDALHQRPRPRPRALKLASSRPYAELQVTTNFTFLTGASHPDEYVQQAAIFGHAAIAVTDRNSLAGIVRAHAAAKEIGIPLAVGCRLDMTDAHGVSLLVYPTSRAAYGRLCRLLTLGKRRASKGECHLTLHDVLEHQEGVLGVAVVPPIVSQDVIDVLHGLRRVFGDDRLSLAVSRFLEQDDDRRVEQLAALAEHVNVPLVATNDVHYHAPERRALQDVLTCIRHGCTIEQAGFRLFPNAERHLKSPEEMAALFHDHPQAIDRAVEVALLASAFSLDELRYEYPDEIVPLGATPMQHLINLTWQGAWRLYPASRGGVPEKVRKLIEHEFKLIEELNYAPYFLTVHDLVRFAREKDILCQGRGAAANSAVCYCLGVTAVDPDRVEMLFERFVSKERNEPPDIDIDFEHERREEVIQYLYRKYGRDRAALTAEVISYRGRSAVRDVGKALGLSLDCVDALAKDMDWWSDSLSSGKSRSPDDRLREVGLQPDDPIVSRLVELVGQIQGFPRHLSQHVGGFVITRGPLCEMVPIENAAMDDRTVIEWDKDDVDAMGMLKVDVLGLGMLTCLRKTLELLNEHRPEPVLSVPPPAVPASKPKPEKAASSFGRFNPRRNLVLAALVDPQGTAPSESPKPAVAKIVGGPVGGVHAWPLELHGIPPEDPAVYDMICAADTVGVFQIESRAQMSMLPRLKPRNYYDLVIEVAIVRPGPIQGNMVHPYLKRRNGEEEVTYPDELVERVLKRTLGVPLFQEQCMSLAIVAAGFTPGEADQLRRAIAAWKTKEHTIATFGRRIVEGMVERGYGEDLANRCFEQIKGFSGYGFPESHAASFALLVYSSSWLKRYHPAAFAAALLNSQPMGFYAPAQIVRDAQEHGVLVRPIDVHHSRWDCTLEDKGRTLRLGMRLVKGLSEPQADLIAKAAGRGKLFKSISSLRRASGVSVRSLRCLARADAFGSMGLDRQKALWHVQALGNESLPLFDAAEAADDRGDQAAPALPEVPPLRKVSRDYAAVGLSLRAHPVSFIRGHLDSLGATPNGQLKDQGRWPHGQKISVAGVVLVRQRPSTANGIIFMTLEDETGVANLIVRQDVYRRFRKAARHSTVILASGKVERQGAVVHVLVERVEGVSISAEPLEAKSRDFR